MELKQLARVCAILSVTASLFGCASYGNESISDQQKVSQIQVGKTTKGDVKNVLGMPGNVSFADNGDEIWTYQHVSTNAAAYIPFVGLFKNGINEDNLTVRFSSRGIVKAVGQGKAL
ncbi:outer membrane protein assembly factor BamE domain-containing protein [Paraburkholderia sediminicola]|uniref:outer membrane protein assembly factor BamE domain-containing protein n=1 Tax=Paraburkholderia sediminicola TaxID=458836 RepID=UPI0038BB9B26